MGKTEFPVVQLHDLSHPSLQETSRLSNLMRRLVSLYQYTRPRLRVIASTLFRDPCHNSRIIARGAASSPLIEEIPTNLLGLDAEPLVAGPVVGASSAPTDAEFLPIELSGSLEPGDTCSPISRTPALVPPITGLSETSNDNIQWAPNSGPLRRRNPAVKILLCATGEKEICSEADVKYARRIFSKRLKYFEPANLRVYDGDGRIDSNWGWFFSPHNVLPGDVLILLVSGHAIPGRYPGTFALQLEIGEGVRVDALVLQEAISRLPKHCTLEIILGTCHAEALTNGLHRVWVAGNPLPMAARTSLYGTSSMSHCNTNSVTGLNTPMPNVQPPRVQIRVGPAVPPSPASRPTQAVVIVWAATVREGLSWPEAKPLEGRKRRHDTMIGAICGALDVAGPNISRRDVCMRIDEAARRENAARRERDLVKGEQERAELGPRVQTPLVLSSISDQHQVLDGPIFQPLSNIQSEVEIL